jgi:hypothetical protein
MESRNSRIEIEISDQIRRDLVRVYGKDNEQLRAVLSVAVSQWSATVFGRTRYRSLTELFLSWLGELMALNSAPLDLNERPLYETFNFPYGQAQYLSRVLRESQPALLRIKHLAELETTLEDRRAKAREWIADKRGEERLRLQLSKAAKRELDRLLGLLAKEGKPVQPLKVEGSLGDYVVVLLIAQDLEPLLDRAAAVRSQFNKSD